VTILGFIIWWPIGLALLFFTLGSRKMGCWSHQDRWQNKMERMQYKMERMRGRMERRGFSGFGFGPPSSGNRAFDEYRTETLQRLEKSRSSSEFPRPPAPRQGQGRVRRVHVAAQAASDPADRPAAAGMSG
jgi:hypothetical protein